ncbi:hypothetical protein YC2023_013511 [Brassica napus]
MQTEIDTYKYIYRGQASFNVQLLMESTESWEPGTVILKRSGPLIKQQRRSCVLLREILKELLIKVPCGKSKQFVLISYDGSSHPISTPNVRLDYENASKQGTGRTQKRTSLELVSLQNRSILDWHNNNNKGTTLAMCKQYV